ncbi:hypothetical protein ACVGVM_19975 [Pseudonocardia bannensis]|uniref:MucB/RseB N-terminal domain-containing protein n=1 Tax=Pseudonocardia bannensis TaxID=630973 RepID=A0A848DNA7_9PSEU|nr:hypothetical protein [Pseudonocardia bannensis]NMH94013.1 hypothetical protein [Pseudonocardia bannensis]
MASSDDMVAAHRFSRRWLLVAAGAAALVGLGVARDAPPAGAGPDRTPEQWRTLLLGSAAQPYVGYALSRGRLGLPDLPQLEQVTELLASTTRIRAFVAGPDRWRVDELTPAGERGTYRLGDVDAVWDFGANQLTRVIGTTPVRLPRAADLLPPELARRLVGLAPGDSVSALPARRIAHHSAAGVRVTPRDPDTTIGRVDIWVERSSGLPLRVEVAARDDPAPVLITEFRDVDLTAPDAGVLVPAVPPGAGSVRTQAADLTGALRVRDPASPPDRLAGRDRVRLGGPGGSDELPGVGLYGTGLAGFALIPLPGRVARRAIDGATGAGGVPVAVPDGVAVRLSTPLMSVVIRGGAGRGRGGVLLVGTVAPEVLEQAARELPVRRRA